MRADVRRAARAPERNRWQAMPVPPHVEQCTPASVVSLLPQQNSREARLADRSCFASRLDEGATTENLGREDLIRKQLRSVLTDEDESDWIPLATTRATRDERTCLGRWGLGTRVRGGMKRQVMVVQMPLSNDEREGQVEKERRKGGQRKSRSGCKKTLRVEICWSAWLRMAYDHGDGAVGEI